MAVVFAGLLIAGCAGMPLYGAPAADTPRATLTAVNRLGPGEAGDPDRVALFKVDGVRIAEQGGAGTTTVTPGQHRIELFADHNGRLRFATLCADFVAGVGYTLVVTASPGLPGWKERPYNVAVFRDGGGPPLTHLDF